MGATTLPPNTEPTFFQLHYWPNGQVSKVSHQRFINTKGDRVLHGECRYYTEKGMLFERSYYHNGKRHGEYETWNIETGARVVWAEYEHGVLVNVKYYVPSRKSLQLIR